MKRFLQTAGIALAWTLGALACCATTVFLWRLVPCCYLEQEDGPVQEVRP